MAKFDHSTDWFYKYPEEVFDVAVDFNNDIASGDSISAFTATPIDNIGNEVAGLISGLTASTPNTGKFTISGGVADSTYTIKVVAFTTNTKTYVHNLTLEVFGALSIKTQIAAPYANSYATLQQANDYIRNKYGHTNNWDTLSDEGKKRLLIEATNDIDTYNFVGAPYYDSQSLQFPRKVRAGQLGGENHEVITGNCATPITLNSFRHSSLWSSTYGKYPTSYWKQGTVHITAGTPANNIVNVASSNVTNGSITLETDFSATPTTNSSFIVFAPMADYIVRAQIEQALYLVENKNVDELTSMRDIGIKRVEIGRARLDFDSAAVPNKVAVSPEAKKLLSRWIRGQIRIGRA